MFFTFSKAFSNMSGKTARREPAHCPSRRRLKGGWKQRLAAGEGTGEDSRPSALVVGLLLDWADGNRSAWKLQRDVSNAYEDGLRHPMVRKFASVRAGRHAQEGLRSLFSDLGVDALQTRLDGVRSVTRLLLPSTSVGISASDLWQ